MSCLTLFPVLGYNVVIGKGKILFFGQEAFSLAAVYSLWVLVMQYGVSFPLALIAALIFTIIVSLIFSWLSLRLEPDAFGVLSIAVHLSFLAVVLNWQSVTRGALGIPRIPRAPWPISLEAFTLVVVLVAIVWITTVWLLDRSRFGRAITALSEHPWHAQSLGISKRNIHIIAFLIAGIGSLISAILFPSYIFLVSPADYQFPAFVFFVMVVVAGVPGSVRGCVIAMFLLMFLKEGLRFLLLDPSVLGPVRLMLFGFVLFIAVYYRRDTLFPKQRSI